MDDGIKARLSELLNINQETLNKPESYATGARVLELAAIQIADSLNDIKRIADGIERIANALVPGAEPADLELEELNARGDKVSVDTDEGRLLFSGHYIRVDGKPILTPKAHPDYEFEQRDLGAWHGTRRLKLKRSIAKHVAAKLPTFAKIKFQCFVAKYAIRFTAC